MVKRYDPYKGWGFVECHDLPSDALLSRRDVDKCIDDIKNGDQVSFAIDFTVTGKPCARELEIFVEAGDRFVGAIKLINGTKKFDFVTCHDLHEAVGQDIFVGERPLAGFVVGDLVSFALKFNLDGRPQANELSLERPVDGTDGMRILRIQPQTVYARPLCHGDAGKNVQPGIVR